jgi:hypothetical protein
VSIFEKKNSVKSGHFWSSVLVKLPTKVYPKIFFLIRFYKTRQTSTNIQLLDFNFWKKKKLQNTEKFQLFWALCWLLRPRRGHPLSKFWKFVEQKLFLMSVCNFLDYSSLQFLSLKFSHTKTLQPIKQVGSGRKTFPKSIHITKSDENRLTAKKKLQPHISPKSIAPKKSFAKIRRKPWRKQEVFQLFRTKFELNKIIKIVISPFFVKICIEGTLKTSNFIILWCDIVFRP